MVVCHHEGRHAEDNFGLQLGTFPYLGIFCGNLVLVHLGHFDEAAGYLQNKY